MLLRRWLIAVLLMAGMAMPLQAEESWQINLKDADIEAFISQVADITGKSFVLDPRVKGKVSVLSSEPMNQEGVYELFLSVLQIHGLAAVPAGDVTLVIQQNDVKQAGRSLEERAAVDSQELLTKVIMIKNTPALDLVPILRPLVAKYGHLAGVKSANALIISDHAININRIEEIIDRLDRSGSEELEVVQLKEAWVGNVVTMLQSLDPSKVSQGTTDNNNTAGSIRVVADERSNRLIIKGEKTARERIRGLIEQLDQPSYFSGSAQVIRLQYADATKLAEMLKNLMGEASGSGDEAKVKGDIGIHADEDLNALVVRAEPSILKEVQELVNSLDVRRAQVLIESAIIEVTGDTSDALGVQWVRGDLDSPVAGTNFNNAGPGLATIATGVATGDYASAVGQGLTIGGFKESGGDIDFGVIIQALKSNSSTNLLSTPSIMTLDNQEAEIVVGQNVPFVTGQTASSTNTNPFTTIDRQDVGVTLKVIPHIHDGEAIRLEVEATAESVSNTTVAGSADLITNKRSIKTMILSDDGETIVLGGLIRDDVREVVSKVPLLGDIPLLGWLFRSKSVNQVKSNLMVFLRPTIVGDGGKAKDLTREKFNGIWEFTVSEELGIDEADMQLQRLFKGLPMQNK
ncbi:MULTISPECIES: type II secretion system secretin GspD [Thalassolituus]|jgi:general secretion pathway protein D|uniref:General secretion pathway protein D n=1 Tax=Thalassolituus maritimus TaxID=484498 RepID=A0A1N7MEU0_9GAMM|nr:MULTISPECIES: type II secretion system secretin GspD [Thalassolituus]KZY95473.1 type II secretion system protein GspD [Oleibacter sp. HI0075]MAX85309.1 type II secretion system protein GspD [Oceanospirillaceae bacterium]MEC8908960.1 type II secretion system secretin GspD [Pseudomonadota bacterium]MEC9409264.1 type II secretion system secretin GspD [Pseudomonadota bacterium]MED5440701.1 type II secretion system secretin GspD [Pseudomonadota bacterium]|tara:strand:+ start:41559 stop:43454 length:1896 start_codon:yes stop_codon:yes gene_type:complete